MTIPATTTTVTKYTFSWGGGQLLTMNAGDRFNLSFNMTATGCGTGTKAPVLHYGGTTYTSQFATAVIPIDVPTQPASLTATAQSDGTAVLTWPEPTTGAPISFYRIYRDGSTYANRYDRTAGAQSTYTDTSTGGVPHTYYITAVDSQLAESTLVGPVTR